jgi:hypothetical protein
MFAQNSGRLIRATVFGSALVWWAVSMPRHAHAQAPDPSTQLRVRSIGVGYSGGYGGARRRAWAVVLIDDGNGNPVNGATVVGNWSGCFKQLNDWAVTDTLCWYDEYGTVVCDDGRADVWGDKLTSCWGYGKACSFIFTITNVSKPGMTYVPDPVKTTASIRCN